MTEKQILEQSIDEFSFKITEIKEDITKLHAKLKEVHRDAMIVNHYYNEIYGEKENVSE